jgi:hypothetical protein
MKRIAPIVALLILASNLAVGKSAITTVEVQRLTAWKLEKSATTATSDLKNLIVQGPNRELVLLILNPQTLRVLKLSNLYVNGNLKGPQNAPGTVISISEPQLPRQGEYVSFIGQSGGKKYLVSLHISGEKVFYSVIPDTTFDGVGIKWNLVWFRLNANGNRFFGVVTGEVTTKGKKGSCIALISMGTNGTGMYFINRPKWNGKSFEYSKSGPGKLIAPIGIAQNTGALFYKAEIGASGKHGIYSCANDSKNTRLVYTAETTFTQSATSAKVFAQDLITDDGKMLILNDNGMNHPGAVAIEVSTSAIKARLSHKSVGFSCNGMHSIFVDSTGLGIEFVIGGDPLVLITPNSPNYPAVGKINNRVNQLEPPTNAVTCNPLGMLSRSETDVVQTGEVYFIKFNNLPLPAQSKLLIDPPVVDFGIVDENTTAILGIRNENKTALTGTATIMKSEGCNPFSFQGEETVRFQSIGDIPVYVNTTCMSNGFSYESTIKVASSAGTQTIPVIATKNDPNRLLGIIGIGRNHAFVGTHKIKLKDQPYQENGKTMIPLKFFTEYLPCDYKYDEENETLVIDYQNTVANFVIGESKCLVGDKEKELLTAPVVKNGSIFLPLTVLTNVFEATAKWFPNSKSILVNMPMPVWGRESLEITGIPQGANVLINNEPAGKTPLSLKHLKQGIYWVKVNSEGYEKFEQTVELPPSPGKVLYFLQKIVPTKTELVIASTPKNCYVYIDEKIMGQTPCKIEVDPGLRKLRVALSSYPDYIIDLVCIAGQKQDLNPNLEELKPKLESYVTPKSMEKQITIGDANRLSFTVTVENKLLVPARFNLSAPANPPPGFTNIGFIGSDGLVQDVSTPKMLPGEKMMFTLAVDISEDATPSDFLTESLTIVPEDIPSWKTQIPIEITFNQTPPTIVSFQLVQKGNAIAGESFDIDVFIKDAKNLSAFSFDFVYQTTKMQILNIIQGTLMNSDGASTHFYWTEESKGEISITGPSRIGNVKGISGDGLLFTMKFDCKKPGEALLDCSHSYVYNDRSKAIEHYTIQTLVITIEEKTDLALLQRNFFHIADIASRASIF